VVLNDERMKQRKTYLDKAIETAINADMVRRTNCAIASISDDVAIRFKNRENKEDAQRRLEAAKNAVLAAKSGLGLLGIACESTTQSIVEKSKIADQFKSLLEKHSILERIK